MKTKALVTGACGFIGSHLVEGLVGAGVTVKAMCQYNSQLDIGNLRFLQPHSLAAVEIVHGDIRDAGFVLEAMRDCHTVYHLASLIGIPYSYQAPRSYIDTIVGGASNVFEAGRTLGTERIVHTSTSEVYGTAQFVPMTEDHPLQAQSPYAACKIGADKLAESYACSFGLPVVTVRPFNVYGPRQSPRAVIPTIIGQLLAGKPEVVLGNLGPCRDYTYVTDTVVGFMLAAGADSVLGGVCNLGSGASSSIASLAEMLVKMIKPDTPIVSTSERMRPDDSEVQMLLASSGLARELLGWQSKVTLEAGLQRTIDFLRRHPQFWLADTYAR